MIDVMSKKCIEPGCKQQPVFNLLGETKGLYCCNHKKDGMIDVKTKKCIESGCNQHPCFNLPGKTNKLYCNQHKKDGMINVKSKRCAECKTTVWYGLPGFRASHCAQHKLPGMIPYPRRTCEMDLCRGIATWGVRSIPERCDEHKQPSDRDLAAQRCCVCQNVNIVDQDGLCDVCSVRGVNIRLGRQKQVKAALDQTDCKDYNSYDRIAYDDGTTCGRERPDFVWDCGFFKIVLEVDEHQHDSRPCTCEINRMINITQALFTPVVWIRYNPDTYKGQKSEIRDKHRLDYLVRTIKACKDLQIKNSINIFPSPTSPTLPTSMLQVVYLFYDDFDITKPFEMHNIYTL